MPSTPHAAAPLRPPCLVLEGGAIDGIASFYAEINRVFMPDEDWQLGPSLDALDDMLYGAYGALAGHTTVQLHWKDIAHSRRALGVAATRTWLQAKLDPAGPFNPGHVSAQLQALERGEGQTYFDIVMQIIAAHPNVTLLTR
ncbi:ribonuclease inhibitor [Stenotrophomonas sp. P5_B8]